MAAGSAKDWRGEFAGGGVVALLVYSVLVLLPGLLVPALFEGLGANSSAIQLARPIAYLVGCGVCAVVGVLLARVVSWTWVLGALVYPLVLGASSLLVVLFGPGIPSGFTGPFLSVTAAGAALALGYACGKRTTPAGRLGRTA